MESWKRYCRHLLGLINEVLDMARIESGKITLAQEDSIFYLINEDNRFITAGTAYSVMGAERMIKMANANGKNRYSIVRYGEK